MPIFKSGKGCFKTGCLGCLVVVGAFVAVLLVWTLIRSSTASAPKQEHVERSLPFAAPPEPAGQGAEGQGTASQGTAGRELPSAAILAAEPLHLELRLAKGRFTVEPGKPGEALRVEADYDSSRFELSEHYDAAERRYEIHYDARGGWWGLIGHSDRSDGEVRIIVPPGVPFVLDAKISTGQSDLELGGLSLTEADLSLGIGQHRLSFREPLPAPVERIDLDGSIGDIRLDRLGNASPRRLRAHHNLGNMDIDLTGAWLRDSEIEVECGMGECRVRTPDDVNVTIERATVALGEVNKRGNESPRSPRPGAPTLRLRVAGTMGQVDVR